MQKEKGACSGCQMRRWTALSGRGWQRRVSCFNSSTQRMSRTSLFNQFVVLPFTPLKWWLALFVFAISAIWMVLASVLPLPAGMGEAVKFIGYCFCCVASIRLCARPVARWHLGLHGAAPAAAGGQARPGWLKTALVVAIALALLLLLAKTFSRSSNAAADSITTVFQSLGFGQSVANDVWIALTVTAFAPLGEEFLFRALIMRSLYDGLRKFRHKWLQCLSKPALALAVAVLVSSIVFADSHGSEAQSAQVYALAVMGAILALSYAISGSLFAPVMAHAINNMLALLMIIRKMPPDAVSVAAVVAICSGPLLALALLLAIRQLIRQ